MTTPFRLIPNSARVRPNTQSGRERAVGGRVDYHNAGKLRRILFDSLRGAGTLVALDCSRVSFMDGAAVATLLEFSMACRRAATRLVLVKPSLHVIDAFSLYGLGNLVRELMWREDTPPDRDAVEELGGLLIVLDDELADLMSSPIRLAG